jgi:hypothetical protein
MCSIAIARLGVHSAISSLKQYIATAIEYGNIYNQTLIMCIVTSYLMLAIDYIIQ